MNNDITAQYHAPPPTMGSITVTLPEATAQKLLALLARCNGSHFDRLHAALNIHLPTKNRVDLLRLEPQNGSLGVTIDLFLSTKFVPA